MSLKLALDSALTNVVSTDGTNPITTTHPVSGSTQTVQVYLFNDDNTKYYTSISITPTDTNSADGDQSTWIELSSDGTTYQAAGAVLNMSDIGSSGTPDTTGHSVYVRVTSAVVSDSQNKTDIKLNVQAQEFAV